MHAYRDEGRIVVGALIAPFRRFGLFLRCAIVPYLAFVTAVIPMQFGSNGADYDGILIKVSAVFFILALLMLPVLASSYMVNWRRAIIFEGTEQESSPLVRLDRLTIPSLTSIASKPGAVMNYLRDEAKSNLRLSLGLLVLIVVVAAGAYLSRGYNAQFSMPHVDAVFVACAIYSVLIYFQRSTWQSTSEQVIDASNPRATPSSPKADLRVIFGAMALCTFVLLMACRWATRTAFPADAPLENSLTAAVWLAVGLLTMSWSAAADSLIFRQSIGAPQPGRQALSETA